MNSRSIFHLLGALLLSIVLLTGCQQDRPFDPTTEAAEPELFRDVTEEWGLDFQHDAGPVGSYFMPQIIGSGAALFDYDQDGRLDIYLLQNAGPKSKSTNRLFHQEKDRRFREVADSGLEIAGFGMGAAVGDINNDGWPDVLVTQYGGARLFLNNGNGTFTEVTRDAGLDTTLWGTSACFLDYDRDGWLDFVITNYVDYGSDRPCTDSTGRKDYCPPQVFPGTVTKLYHNLGRPPADGKTRVRFEDGTSRSGLGTRLGPGLGVVSADFDGDGWPDILVANDGKPNHLWINQKNGTFREAGLARGLALNAQGQSLANMGIALGDVDGDLRFDIVIPHLTEEPLALWRQGTKGMFRDVAASGGLATPRQRGTGFGIVLADFDHDGALDLGVVNGRVMFGHSGDHLMIRGPGKKNDFWSFYVERNQLFVNDGKGNFRDVTLSNPEFCGREGIYRGLACGDIDGDGAMDLLVTSVAGPARLFKNVAPKQGHWLIARVFDPALHRDAYGAEVTVTADGRRWGGWVNPGYSFLCSNDPRLHFGLGSAERVESFEVQWPDGARETFAGCSADQAVELRRGTAKPVLLKMTR
jgi:hypothetical protein